MQNMDAIEHFIRGEITKHKETYDANNMRDLVDLYIQAEKNDFKDMKGMDGMIFDHLYLCQNLAMPK